MSAVGIGEVGWRTAADAVVAVVGIARVKCVCSEEFKVRFFACSGGISEGGVITFRFSVLVFTGIVPRTRSLASPFHDDVLDRHAIVVGPLETMTKK